MKMGIFTIMTMAMLTACASCDSSENVAEEQLPEDGTSELPVITEGLATIPGGTFMMGSPASEAWRMVDETQHTVTLSDFQISLYEVSQMQYASLMGQNPSAMQGNDLPVENVSWTDAIRYCNALSEHEGLEAAYRIEGNVVTWNRSANGYRLPTEAEWEYACRAGSSTPFNTGGNVTAAQANWYTNYPYIDGEGGGAYNRRTVPVTEYEPNTWGLYNMHGNVGEWCWDAFGSYDALPTDNPAAVADGSFRVVRGGSWFDVGKHLRSAYRSVLPAAYRADNIGFRVARNTGTGVSGIVSTRLPEVSADNARRTLIVYFSESGNTRGLANRIQALTGADIFEIRLVNPYPDNYSALLDRAQEEQRTQARPALRGRVENMEQYGTILLGYPNWWACIPMPVATFLESYDFSDKTIVPFCSHGNGQMGQTVPSICKLAPDTDIREPLSVTYSGGSSLDNDIRSWLSANACFQNRNK
ncbi:flavodoxin [Parabacteroides timonensis]|uniref:flavodoxin n=1 Tax=Parabacteroides timonensis TaxID=1871013 RepID=UPI0009E4884E|nr:flavodoxin [Parabacteroides timonensis]